MDARRLNEFGRLSPTQAWRVDAVCQRCEEELRDGYKLLRQIGKGRMGVVHLAEQKSPIRRRVALKIIGPGPDTDQIIARFEAERQALALLDHPHIAKLFDAGTTETGWHYFVMELVRGVPITDFCDQNQLTPIERLELFIRVCQAVQHAHQKGIIHCDIKPSNILVSLDDPGAPGVPKVIDFGLAKAFEQPLTEQSMCTQFGQVVGTLEYMSPEQAELGILDIDTRSDIYSLGVVLYELLTGSTPLERAKLRQAGYVESLQRIRDEETAKPSIRLSESRVELATIAQRRQTDPARLAKLVRGELDWIVMRALEKDRTRRYKTAGGLARDIERFLGNEPIEAGPPSATARLKKFSA
jgi:serine/threonine protein kinase